MKRRYVIVVLTLVYAGLLHAAVNVLSGLNPYRSGESGQSFSNASWIEDHLLPILWSYFIALAFAALVRNSAVRRALAVVAQIPALLLISVGPGPEIAGLAFVLPTLAWFFLCFEDHLNKRATVTQ